MNQQSTPITQLQNNVSNQTENENQVVNDILNEISQDQQTVQPQDMSQQNIQQTMQEVPQQMQQMNYNTDPNIQQMPQHLNPQGSQTDFGQFLQSKGYQSVPFYEQILSEAKSPLVVAVIFFMFSQNFLQKMIVGLSEKFKTEAGGVSTMGLVLVSLLAGVSYWGVNRMINKN